MCCCLGKNQGSQIEEKGYKHGMGGQEEPCCVVQN